MPTHIYFGQIKGHNSRTEKVVKSKIKLSLPFMIPDLVHKIKIICLWGTKVTERKQNAECMHKHG